MKKPKGGWNQNPKKLRDCGKDFVNYLIKLTREKKLIWEPMPRVDIYRLNTYEATKDQLRFTIKTMQGEVPYLRIEILDNQKSNHHFIGGYNYNIERLNQAIYKQQKEQEKMRKIKTIKSKNEKEQEREKLIARAVIFTTFKINMTAPRSKE